MAKKLYIGNLPHSVDNDQLQDLFEKFGSVTSATVINDRETGRSKGFGFVEFSDAKEADDAISEMNGKEVGGRALTVNEARPREDRPAGNRPSRNGPPRSRNGGGFGGGFGGGGRR